MFLCISDDGADTCVLGDGWHIESHTSRTANIVGFDTKVARKGGLPIVTALTVVNHNGHDILLRVNEGVYNAGNPTTLLSEFQMRQYGCIVDSVSNQHLLSFAGTKGTQCLQPTPDITIPFVLNAGLMTFMHRLPTATDLGTLPIIDITADQPWNPANHQDTTHPIIPPLDPTTIQVYQAIVPPPPDIPTRTIPEPTVTAYYFDPTDTSKPTLGRAFHLSISYDKYICHQDVDAFLARLDTPALLGRTPFLDQQSKPIPSSIQLCTPCPQPAPSKILLTPTRTLSQPAKHFGINTPLIIPTLIVSTKVFPMMTPLVTSQTLPPSTFPPTSLPSNHTWATNPWKLSGTHWQKTTQLAKAILRYPLRRHIKSRFPQLNRPRLREKVATDTYFANCRDVTGATCAQVFYGMTSHMINVYGLRTESQAPEAYADFLRHEGAPTDLRRDNSKVQSGRKFQDLNRLYMIGDQFTEPHHPQQNPAENGAVRWLKNAYASAVGSSWRPSQSVVSSLLLLGTCPQRKLR